MPESFPNKFAASFRVGIAAISLLTALAAGCAKPSNHIRPRLVVAPDGRAHLVLQRMAFDLQEDEYRIFAADAPDYANWRETGQYAGRLVSLLADERGLVLVHASGAAIRFREGAANALVAVSGRVELGAAAWTPANDNDFAPSPESPPGDENANADNGGDANDADGVDDDAPLRGMMAVGQVPEGLQLLRLDGGRWLPGGPELRLKERIVWQTQLAGWGNCPAVCWTILPDDGEARMLGAAFLYRGAWRSLPLPAHEAGAHAALTEAADGGLRFLVEGPAGEGVLRTRLELWYAPPPPDADSAGDHDSGDGDEVPAPSWRAEAAISLPAGWQTRRGYGLALAEGVLPADGPLLLAARSDAGGVHAWSARPAATATTGDDGPEWRWTPTGRVIAQGRAESWAMLGLALLFAGVAALLIGMRLLRDRGPWVLRARPRPGGTEAILDRALAFAVDMAVVLPFPLAFHLHATDYGALWIPPTEHARLYWVWLAGVAVYKSVFEIRWGQTLGKKLMGLRVRAVDGGPARPGQILTRNLALVLDCFPVSLGPGGFLPYLVALTAMAFNRRRRRVGDLLAGTVVRRHVPAGQRLTILASASPRRLELLVRLGLRVEIPKAWLAGDEDERRVVASSPTETAMRRAREKVLRVHQQLILQTFGPGKDGKGQARRNPPDRLLIPNGPLIIGGDTVVALDDETLDKPADPGRAREMLARLSGRIHQVHSGVVLADAATGQVLMGVETTEVEFRELSTEEIDAYVAGGEPLDRAGAYAIQGGARSFVKTLRGSLSNVIGLPMELLRRLLDDLDG